MGIKLYKTNDNHLEFFSMLCFCLSANLPVFPGLKEVLPKDTLKFFAVKISLTMSIEAEFLDVIGTKGFLLAFHSHLY
jgi:hypothetical protein